MEHGEILQVEQEKLQDAKEAFPYKCKEEGGKKRPLKKYHTHVKEQSSNSQQVCEQQHKDINSSGWVRSERE